MLKDSQARALPASADEKTSNKIILKKLLEKLDEQHHVGFDKNDAKFVLQAKGEADGVEETKTRLEASRELALSGEKNSVNQQCDQEDGLNRT